MIPPVLPNVSGPKRGGRPSWINNQGEEGIVDDARRSISVRIRVAELGRLRALAKRLRTRESNIFRYVLRIGLARLTNVLDGAIDPAQRCRLLVQLVAEFAGDFGMDARACVALLNSTGEEPLGEFSLDDLDLIDLSATHPRVVQEHLAGLRGGRVPPENLAVALSEYLNAKYQALPAA